MAGGENPELVIDKEGTWLYNGQPIVNKAIYLFFNQNLEYSPAGGYQVRVGAEVSPVAVEDTPFVVTDVVLVEQAGRAFLKFISMTKQKKRLIWNRSRWEKIMCSTAR